MDRDDLSSLGKTYLIIYVFVNTHILMISLTYTLEKENNLIRDTEHCAYIR